MTVPHRSTIAPRRLSTSTSTCLWSCGSNGTARAAAQGPRMHRHLLPPQCLRHHHPQGRATFLGNCRKHAPAHAEQHLEHNTAVLQPTATSLRVPPRSGEPKASSPEQPRRQRCGERLQHRAPAASRARAPNGLERTQQSVQHRCCRRAGQRGHGHRQAGQPAGQQKQVSTMGMTGLQAGCRRRLAFDRSSRR